MLKDHKNIYLLQLNKQILNLMKKIQILISIIFVRKVPTYNLELELFIY